MTNEKRCTSFCFIIINFYCNKTKRMLKFLTFFTFSRVQLHQGVQKTVFLRPHSTKITQLSTVIFSNNYKTKYYKHLLLSYLHKRRNASNKIKHKQLPKKPKQRHHITSLPRRPFSKPPPTKKTIHTPSNPPKKHLPYPKTPTNNHNATDTPTPPRNYEKQLLIPSHCQTRRGDVTRGDYFRPWPQLHITDFGGVSNKGHEDFSYRSITVVIWLKQSTVAKATKSDSQFFLLTTTTPLRFLVQNCTKMPRNVCHDFSTR